MSDLTLSKGERTRIDLIEAAFKLFARQGFHGTSMRQIAEEAGLTVGSIYNHFPGKNDIFLAVILAYHPLTKLSLLSREMEGEEVEELIRNLFRQLTDELQATPGLLNLALVEFVEMEGQHIPTLMETFWPEMMALVQRLAANEEQLRPIPPFAMFRAFVGMVIAYLLTAEVLRPWLNNIDGLGTLDDFIDIYLHGILDKTDIFDPRMNTNTSALLSTSLHE